MTLKLAVRTSLHFSFLHPFVFPLTDALQLRVETCQKDHLKHSLSSSSCDMNSHSKHERQYLHFEEVETVKSGDLAVLPLGTARVSLKKKSRQPDRAALKAVSRY